MRIFNFFYIKVLLKSPIFISFIIFLLFLLFNITSSLEISIFKFVEVFYYGFISSNLFSLISSTLAISNRHENLIFFERNIIKKQTNIILSIIL